MCNYKAWCKATNKENSEPRSSQNWVSSKRTWFNIFDHRIECGSWKIPKASIKKAIACRSKQMFISVTILQLETEQGTYQFGFNPWANPIDYLNIEVEEQMVKLKQSAFSIIARIVLLVYIGYWVWTDFMKN